MKAAHESTGKSRVIRLKLDLIRTDAGTQTRDHIDYATVADYAEAMTRGDRFPPVVVFKPKADEFLLADGFHRVRAARKSKFTTIAADIRRGSRTDALRYSLQANHAHGLRRTSQDKRFAIGLALREFSSLSDRAIADMCGVSHSSVAIVRRQLDDSSSSGTRTGMDGKIRRLPVRSQTTESLIIQVISPAAHNNGTSPPVLMELAKSLSVLEDAVREAVERYPVEKDAIRRFIAKTRHDLANWDKQIAAGAFPAIHVISLGAGVQSSTMALMAARRELTPMPACAIFADTQNETQSVYRWIEHVLKPNCEPHFNILIVSKGDLGATAARPRISASTGKIYSKPAIPFFVLKEPGKPPGRGARRQCTSDFKIEVIQRALREVLGIKQGGQAVLVKQWLGISTDEAHRARDSQKPWIQNVYPLIDKGMSRKDCQDWLKKNGFPEAPRSACVYCPFHSDDEWLRLKNAESQEFAKAVKWEKRFQAVAALPNSSMVGKPFLHRSCVPLDQVKFNVGTNSHSWGEECSGNCGV